MKNIDWWFWGICALFLLLLLLGICGCSTIRSIILGPTIGQQPEPIIPTSPAAQMWKAIAKTNWVVTICLLGFGGGLFTFFNGKPKLGLAIVFSCVGTLFFGLAIHRFPTWMAIIGLVGSIAGVAASILMQHRAIIEIIKGVQLSKGDFGHQWSERKKAINNSQEHAQSPTTQKLVKKIKSDLKLKGEIE